MYSVDVFDKTLDELFCSSFNFRFPCALHERDITAKLIYHYITLRIFQYYKQQDKEAKKLSALKRKESKLKYT